VVLISPFSARLDCVAADVHLYARRGSRCAVNFVGLYTLWLVGPMSISVHLLQWKVALH
jgi:hypothetical protein